MTIKNLRKLFHFLRLLTYLICLVILFQLKAYSQKLIPDISLSINTRGIFLNDISKNAKDAIGFSLRSRIFIAHKLAITPSASYDNFKYKPLDKRIGDYCQMKIGLIYFVNFTGKKLGKYCNSYVYADAGLGVKLNKEMVGSYNCFGYAVGYGINAYLKNRLVFDLWSSWTNLNLTKDISASWVCVNIGLGYQLHK